MEKRGFPRLAKCLPLEFSCPLPDSGEIWSGKGVTQDVSRGGIFFKCDSPQLDLGWRIDLTIIEIIHQPIGYKTLKLKLEGQVARLEAPMGTSPHHGVAVQFLVPMSVNRLVGRGYSKAERLA
ncbi:MAG: PilZ domain-containing protein [Deltaproteobacteria bacterium]|nr:PilZ domain-containing protein [Deltaproteobacteria bacterium]